MYRENALRYINKHPLFTTEEIRDALEIPASKKAVFNVELKRLCDDGEIRRFRKGIYGKAKGNDVPDRQAFLQFLYMRGRNGFEVGDQTLRELGIQTKETENEEVPVIVSNRIARGGRKYGARLVTPKVRLDDMNRSYLEFLDLLKQAQHSARDVDQAESELMQRAQKQDLDWGRLIAYANRYYNSNVVKAVNRMTEKSCLS